jgi:hypothetical protein
MEKSFIRKQIGMILLGISALALSGCSTSQPEEAKESASASAMATASASVEAVDPQAEFASKSASLMATACDDLDLYRQAWRDANSDPESISWEEPDSYVTRDTFLNSLAMAASYDKRWTDSLVNFNYLDMKPYNWAGYNGGEDPLDPWSSEEDIAAWTVLKSSCQIARAGAPS